MSVTTGALRDMPHAPTQPSRPQFLCGPGTQDGSGQGLPPRHPQTMERHVPPQVTSLKYSEPQT